VKKKSQPKRSNVRREAEPLPWKYCLVVLASGAVLVSGFLFAARTHFASINYCIGNAQLRKQLSELEAERRRLTLSKELAMAPAEIKKAARKLGLVDMTAMNIASVDTQTAPLTPPVTSSFVLRTVDTKPIAKPKTGGEAGERSVVRVEKPAAATTGENRERRVSKTGK
jgi:hypothetical protein